MRPSGTKYWVHRVITATSKNYTKSIFSFLPFFAHFEAISQSILRILLDFWHFPFKKLCYWNEQFTVKIIERSTISQHTIRVSYIGAWMLKVRRNMTLHRCKHYTRVEKLRKQKKTFFFCVFLRNTVHLCINFPP